MRRVFGLLLIGALSAAIAGCEASGRVGDEDDDGSYRKTTTVRDDDGDVQTKTEIRRDDD